MTVSEYYQHPAVQARIAEYCGLTTPSPATCHYLIAIRESFEPMSASFPPVYLPDELTRLFKTESDLFRSVWDRAGVMLHIDIEYVNFDYRGEVFVRPESTFRKVEPTFHAMMALSAELQLSSLAIITGQGYHFSLLLPTASPIVKDVTAYGSVLPSLAERYAHGMTSTGEMVTAKEGRLYAGVGKLSEWCAHVLLARAGPQSPIALRCFGMEVGNRGPTGREIVSLDLSAYADPLDRRYTRCAFATYQKQRALATVIGPGIAAHTPPLGCVTREPGEPLDETLTARANLRLAAARAETRSGVLTEAEEGARRLLASYRASPLARFHVWYEQAHPDPPVAWPAGYDRLTLTDLPPCVALPLARPNDLLLKPTNLQNILRVLWARGWHPRHVGGLVWSKYGRDWGWGKMWQSYEAATRADVYLRVLAGLIATGSDDLRDFNCLSHQEKGYCPQPFCGHSLGAYNLPLRSHLP